jgi:hypothetical protein
MLVLIPTNSGALIVVFPIFFPQSGEGLCFFGRPERWIQCAVCTARQDCPPGWVMLHVRGDPSHEALH